MTNVPEGSAPGTQPYGGAFACPRCGDTLEADQRWCLRCGDPARTVIAPTPRWRRPVVALGTLAVIAAGALTAGFIAITDDDPAPARTVTNTITTQPGEALPLGVTPAPGPTGPTGPDGATAPGAQTPAPTKPPAQTP